MSPYTFLNLSSHASSFTLSSTLALTFPFDLDHVGSATLVVRHDSSLPRNVDASGTGTLSLTGHRPMNSASFYELQSEV
jgi:hypothetical protein